MFLIVVNNHIAVEFQIASVVTQQGKGVDTVGWHFDISSDD